MIAFTQHDVQADSDYAMVKRFGIRTVRDGVRWHRIDRGGRYDFSSFVPMLRAAHRHDIQVIWTLFHYGWPDDLDLMSAAFVDRFARFCKATARVVADHSDQVPFYTVVNEPSFFAWAAGHDGNFHPFTKGRAVPIKRQLIRAAVAGAEAVLEVDRRARFVCTDPLINIVEPRDFPELWSVAQGLHDSQFQAWDMLRGRCEPELGGREKYLDIVGVNFYACNQWDVLGGILLWHIEPRDERWVPLHQLMSDAYERYRRPIFLAETSHVGVGRGQWIREIGQEAIEALQTGVPLQGICLYPIIDRHDWDDFNHWHNSGLWDLRGDERGVLHRVLNQEYAGELRRVQRRLAAHGCA
jgi:hypothetical protein